MGIAALIARALEVDRRLRDAETRVRALESGPGSVTGLNSGAKKPGSGPGGGITTPIWPIEGDGGGIFAPDPIEDWPVIWLPGEPWPGVDTFPGGGIDDDTADGPWGPAGPQADQAVQLSKYMRGPNGQYLGSFPVTLTDPATNQAVTAQTAEAGVHGRVAFRVQQGHTYTLSWPAVNGYRAGSESVSITANAGGVYKKINDVELIPPEDTQWPTFWVPPTDWPGVDQFPDGTWSDDDATGPWGSDPPPCGQAVRLSKYFRDSSGNPISGVPATVRDNAGNSASRTSAAAGVVGRAAFRVRNCGTYTISWDAANGYPAGSESVTVGANAGGVHKKTNVIDKPCDPSHPDQLVITMHDSNGSHVTTWNAATSKQEMSYDVTSNVPCTIQTPMCYSQDPKIGSPIDGVNVKSTSTINSNGQTTIIWSVTYKWTCTNGTKWEQTFTGSGIVIGNICAELGSGHAYSTMLSGLYPSYCTGMGPVPSTFTL